MIKLVVFDWNGTLFDDTAIVLKAVNEGELHVLGLPPITLEEYQDNYDMPLYNFYAKFGISREQFDAKSRAIAEAFHPLYEPLAAHALTRPGTREILSEIQRQNIPCVILSNHTVEGIYLQLSRLKIDHYFDAILANDDIETSHHTSKQQRIELYLKEKNFSPEDVIIIGDTVEEIRIGKNLGLHTISITAGNNSEQRLIDAQPTAVIHDLAQIKDVMEELA